MVDNGVPQWSPVSQILFAIHLRGTFKEVEKEMKKYIAKSFADSWR